MANSDPKSSQPGRLNDPSTSLGTDPRTNPKLLPTLTALRLHRNLPQCPLDSSSSLEEIGNLLQRHDHLSAPLYEIPNDVPGDEHEPEIEMTETSVLSSDGHPIKLYIWRLAQPLSPTPKKSPAVVYIHGGGMCLTKTRNATHDRWAKSLVVKGTMVITIDFRNACTTPPSSSSDNNNDILPPLKHHPFPTALNDCSAAVQFLHANKSSLGISTLTLQGESGGANLSLSTTLKAHREGWSSCIDGVYALAPYISGSYDRDESWLAANLPSILENKDYLLSVSTMAIMARYYTPDAKDRVSSLAWPFFAAEEELVGLPPHVVVVDELDPLRDEGLAYARRLAKVGVNVVTKVHVGVPHVSELLFRQALPELQANTTAEIAAFAKSHDRNRL